MAMHPPVELFHSPRTRSTGVLTLLEEMGVLYALHVLDQKKGEHLAADYLAVNPMGKVPAIRVGEALVTEQAAVYMYIADLFPEAGMAPALTDPLRGPYLRWFVYYGSCFEPAIVDRAMKREPAPRAMSPYGDYDTVMKTISDQLQRGSYFLGERMSAVDILWGSALGWMLMFKVIPELPAFTNYVARMQARPAVAKARAIDEKLVAEQAAKE